MCVGGGGGQWSEVGDSEIGLEGRREGAGREGEG